MNVFEHFAEVFNNISFTRGGFNVFIVLDILWCLVLIVMVATGAPLPSAVDIAAVSGTLTGFTTTLGVTKHHKEKDV